MKKCVNTAYHYINTHTHTQTQTQTQTQIQMHTERHIANYI